MSFCTRCGGVIGDKQTPMDDDNGGKLHYYCSWDKHQEKLSNNDVEYKKRVVEREKRYPFISRMRINGCD